MFVAIMLGQRAGIVKTSQCRIAGIDAPAASGARDRGRLSADSV